MKEDLKNLFLIGLGAVSMTSTAAKEMKQEMLKKGEELYNNGKVINEELKHNIQEKIKENVTVVENKSVTKEDLKELVKTMSSAEKKEFISLLKEKEEKNEK